MFFFSSCDVNVRMITMPAIVIRRTAMSRRCSCVVVGRFIAAALVPLSRRVVVAYNSRSVD